MSTLSHLRRVISPLTRSQPHFEARDLHPTQFGRLCPNETPEGQNCGLVKNLALMVDVSENLPDNNVREILDELDRIGLNANKILVCCGGGGLTAGTVTTVSKKSPYSEIIVVEPVGYDDTARSLKEGQILKNKITTNSICDALLAPSPGNLTFQINKKFVSCGIAVTDEDVIKAMSFAWQYLKLVVEPSGAVALAAVLKQKNYFSNLNSVVILSGANVDPEFYSRVIK